MDEQKLAAAREAMDSALTDLFIDLYVYVT